jgi:hypothetical protein
MNSAAIRAKSPKVSSSMSSLRTAQMAGRRASNAAYSAPIARPPATRGSSL